MWLWQNWVILLAHWSTLLVPWSLTLTTRRLIDTCKEHRKCWRKNKRSKNQTQLSDGPKQIFKIFYFHCVFLSTSIANWYNFLMSVFSNRLYTQLYICTHNLCFSITVIWAVYRTFGVREGSPKTWRGDALLYKTQVKLCNMDECSMSRNLPE